jgi:hypothetical protein
MGNQKLAKSLMRQSTREKCKPMKREVNPYLLLVNYEKGHLIQIMQTTPSLKQIEAKLQNDCSCTKY